MASAGVQWILVSGTWKSEIEVERVERESTGLSLATSQELLLCMPGEKHHIVSVCLTLANNKWESSAAE